MNFSIFNKRFFLYIIFNLGFLIIYDYIMPGGANYFSTSIIEITIFFVSLIFIFYIIYFLVIYKLKKNVCQYSKNFNIIICLGISLLLTGCIYLFNSCLHINNYYLNPYVNKLFFYLILIISIDYSLKIFKKVESKKNMWKNLTLGFLLLYNIFSFIVFILFSPGPRITKIHKKTIIINQQFRMIDPSIDNIMEPIPLTIGIICYSHAIKTEYMGDELNNIVPSK